MRSWYCTGAVDAADRQGANLLQRPVGGWTVNRDHVLRVLMLSTFIERIGFGVVIPILPLLLTEPSSPLYILPAGMAVETGYLLLGLLFACYPLGQFIGTPILGQLSDRVGRRKLLIVSVLGTLIANVLFGAGVLYGIIPLLFVAKLLDGVTGGNISIVQAAVADVSDHDHRAAGFGKISAAFGAGFVVGPFLGGVLGSADILPFATAATPFWFAAVLSGLSLVIIYRYLEETSPMEAAPINWYQPIDNIRTAFALPERRRLFGIGLLYYCGFTFFTSFAGVFLIKRFGFDQFMIGNFFLYIGVMIVLTQIVVVPRVFGRFHAGSTLPITLVLTGAAVLALSFQSKLLAALALVPVFSMANGLTQVAITTLISESSDAGDQGLVLGVNSSVRALGQSVPSVLSGAAAAVFAPMTPLVIAGVLMLTTGLFAAIGVPST